MAIGEPSCQQSSCPRAIGYQYGKAGYAQLNNKMNGKLTEKQWKSMESTMFFCFHKKIALVGIHYRLTSSLQPFSQWVSRVRYTSIFLNPTEKFNLENIRKTTHTKAKKSVYLSHSTLTKTIVKQNRVELLKTKT